MKNAVYKAVYELEHDLAHDNAPTPATRQRGLHADPQTSEGKPNASRRAAAARAEEDCSCATVADTSRDTAGNSAGDSADLERFLCPVDEAARIVGQKWTLQIVHHLLDGHSRRFCELQEALGKVNPSTLSSRLKMLEEAGLVTRSQISDIPPHVEYGLTEMGAELRGVINEITRWSNAHLCGIDAPRRKTKTPATETASRA